MLPSTCLARLLIVAMVLSVTSPAQKVDTKSLKDILSKQGFAGSLQGRITFTFLGNMKSNSKALQVYYYPWEQTNPPGPAIHFIHRPLFIYTPTPPRHCSIPNPPLP